ncbi:DNA polymerase III subunit beta [Kitasatospora sp. NPDC004745]|uniref:DNA polymerase III subunit beta n=1 Tax=Kitasatospora sp. NPDC004745 TaxID=3364019 RepID=UPI0036765DD3
MKLRTDQKTLAEAAAWAARQVPGNLLEPIRAGLLLTADGTQLTLAGFDGETSTMACCAADIASSGRAVVSAKTFSAIVGSFPVGDVELTLEDSVMAVHSPGGDFQLATMPLVDFPRLPEMPAPAGTVAGDVLAKAVADIAHLADPDIGAIPALAGIRFTAKGDKLTLATTDRYRVGFRTVPWKPTGVPFETAVVPAKAVAEAVKGAVSDVQLALPGPESMLAGFASGGHTSIIRVIGEAYPPVDKVIPVKYAAEVELDAGELLAAVRRIHLVTEEKKPLRMEFTADRLTVAAASGDLARGSVRLDCQMEGPDRIRVCFNPRYLADGLQAMSGPIRIAITNPILPVLFTSVNDEAARYLSTPVRDPWSTGATTHPAA